MRALAYQARLFGALAQLVERNTGSVEVSGSTPLGSTNLLKTNKKGRCISAAPFFVGVFGLSRCAFGEAAAGDQACGGEAEEQDHRWCRDVGGIAAARAAAR
jgi:hypothetical protein